MCTAARFTAQQEIFVGANFCASCRKVLRKSFCMFQFRMLELPDHTHAAHLWPIAQHNGDSLVGQKAGQRVVQQASLSNRLPLQWLMSCFTFCFDRMVHHEPLGRLFKDLAKHQLPVFNLYRAWSRFTQKFSDRSNFCSFIFVCKTRIQNV